MTLRQLHSNLVDMPFFLIILFDADSIRCVWYGARAELKVTGSFVQIFSPLKQQLMKLVINVILFGMKSR